MQQKDFGMICGVTVNTLLRNCIFFGTSKYSVVLISHIFSCQLEMELVMNDQ